ncbi:PAS domain-containing protein [Fusibacter ferrireducens]|uniref:DUF438 domain-containing protein n=1 Tax=Fusibacter ferrireducens TaxID=2785058 RepID=A0ABR9ZPI8_9FIRM|nr:PAS domain-containing protein [Fusibacter ferrireducens]MBF4692367.1 DUF438 domain-containing protein [Fusibacter ferrireducens]
MSVDEKRVERLIEYTKSLLDGGDGKALYDQYCSDIEHVKPSEVFDIFYHLLQEGRKPKSILLCLDKVINVFYKSLINYAWEKPSEDDFINNLLAENAALVMKIEAIKKIIKLENCVENRVLLLEAISELKLFNEHYLKKENILFPYLEKRMPKFQGLSIMWSLHDRVRQEIRETIEILGNVTSSEKDINQKLGMLIFSMLGVLKKEELILIPVASEVLEHTEWNAMYKQSFEYDFPFIEKPEVFLPDAVTSFSVKDGIYKTETGSLTYEQLESLFSAIPVDLTFIDAQDKVRYFSRSQERIFPRSTAVLGRDVRQCHPPESVDKVLEIIEAFKSGAREKAVFWINYKAHKVWIQYFALRDQAGVYIGTLEVSQIVDEIISIKGEKRLM